MMVEKVLGAKFAISENMASLASLVELAGVVRNAFLGGRISGKKGVIHIHVGTKPERLEPLFELIKIMGSSEQTGGPVPAGEPPPGIPITNFIPTHVNRTKPDVMEHAIRFLRMGGTVDMSAIMSPEKGSPTSLRPDRALSEFLKSKIPIEQVTLSSDGNVPIAMVDEKGNKIGLSYAGVDVLYSTFLTIVKNCDIPFPHILKIVTSNVARVLGIEDRKGSIEVGKDADLILFSKSYEIDWVLARGRLMIEDGKQICSSGLL
jgi:beta-aspartyl-dipeptidase (metallo-type)